MHDDGQAREVIWEAIGAAGGPYSVARAADIHPTMLYAWRKGEKDLSLRSAGRLRAAVPGVDDATWLAALAPLPGAAAEDDAPVAEATA